MTRVCDRRCRTQYRCQAPPWNKDLRLSHSAPHVDPPRAQRLMTCHIALYHVSSCLTKAHDALWPVGRSSCPCSGFPPPAKWVMCFWLQPKQFVNHNLSSSKRQVTLAVIYFCACLVGWSWLLRFGWHCWQYNVLFKPVPWLDFSAEWGKQPVVLMVTLRDTFVMWLWMSGAMSVAVS